MAILAFGGRLRNSLGSIASRSAGRVQSVCATSRRPQKESPGGEPGVSIDPQNRLADMLVECLLNLFLGNITHDLFFHLAIFEDQ